MGRGNGEMVQPPSVWACYPQLLTHPAPRDDAAQATPQRTPEVLQAKGIFSLTLSQSPQGSGWQRRAGKAKCAPPPGKESPSQRGELDVFLLAFSVSL